MKISLEAVVKVGKKCGRPIIRFERRIRDELLRVMIECKDRKKIKNTINDYNEKMKNCVDGKSFIIKKENMRLISSDLSAAAGYPEEHYFAQDIWGAKKIYENMPQNHYDIGSRVGGFLAHILIFLEKVNYIDIRPLPYRIKKLNFIQGDATNLEKIKDESIFSLSSLHAVEHFGLGRYGDPIDPEACFKAIRAFQRVLAIGGKLYFAVPVAAQDTLEFNAHRIFNPQTIINAFDELKLVEFSLIVGKEVNSKVINIDEIAEVCQALPDYSCGLFEFVKLEQ